MNVTLRSFYIKSSLPKSVKVVAWYMVTAIASILIYTTLLYLKDQGIILGLLFKFFAPEDTPLGGYLWVAIPLTILEIYSLKKLLILSRQGFVLSLISIASSFFIYAVFLLFDERLAPFDYVWIIFSSVALYYLLKSVHSFKAEQIVKNTKIILLGIIFYIVLFYLEQLSPLSNFLGWWVADAIVATIVFILTYFFVKDSKKSKLITATFTIILGFVTTFILSTHAYGEASKLCYREYEKTHECEGRNEYGCFKFKDDPLEENGFPRSLNTTDQCANELLPFPWNKKAVIKE